MAGVDVFALAPPAAGLGVGLAAALTAGFFDDITQPFKFYSASPQLVTELDLLNFHYKSCQMNGCQ